MRTAKETLKAWKKESRLLQRNLDENKYFKKNSIKAVAKQKVFSDKYMSVFFNLNKK